MDNLNIFNQNYKSCLAEKFIFFVVQIFQNPHLRLVNSGFKKSASLEPELFHPNKLLKRKYALEKPHPITRLAGLRKINFS